MATENILVKVKHKLTLAADHNEELRILWLSDTARPWSVYSKEQFRRFWDVPYVEPRTETK